MAASGLTELRCKWWNPGAGSGVCAWLGSARIAARTAVKVRAEIFIRNRKYNTAERRGEWDLETDSDREYREALP